MSYQTSRVEFLALISNYVATQFAYTLLSLQTTERV